jgi:ribosomal protein S18 acetylase RimI-like enzyme
MAVPVEGWLLRATPGLERGRLNSALPLVRDPGLEVVEAFYAERGLPAQVQVTPADGHPWLTDELDARDWGSRWPSAVYSGRVDDAAAAAAADGDIALLAEPTADWLAAWSLCEGRDVEDVAMHAQLVLAQLDGRAAYALAPAGAAVGLVVCEDDLAGLFCVAVERDQRRRGLGSAVVGALAAHARERGAREVYLEVEERNAAALAMYARLGLQRRYGYVHRTAPV